MSKKVWLSVQVSRIECPQEKDDRLHLGVPKIRRKGTLSRKEGDEFSFIRYSLITYLQCPGPFAELWGVPQSLPSMYRE